MDTTDPTTNKQTPQPNTAESDPLARFATVTPTTDADMPESDTQAHAAQQEPQTTEDAVVAPQSETRNSPKAPAASQIAEPTDSSDADPKTPPKRLNVLERLQPITATDKLFFIQHLGVMMRAGIPLANALDALAKQTGNPRFAAILQQAQKRVMSGEPLSTALSSYPKVFDTLFISMIRIGETGGMLENVLKQLYIRLKKEHQLVGRIRGALAYPVVVFIAMIGIGIGVIIFIVPQFISIFSEVELELPIMTRVLIAVSETVRNYGLLVAIGVFAAVISFIAVLRTNRGKWYIHAALLKTPILGPIIKKINLARFCRTLSSLLTTDIKIVQSVTITAQTLGNVHYRHAVNQAAERIGKGREINKVLAEYPDLFNHVVLQMIAVGEESGQVDEVLSELAQFYEEQIQEVMDTLPAIIEPIIIIILALAIGAMAMAIVTPMFELTKAF